MLAYLNRKVSTHTEGLLRGASLALFIKVTSAALAFGLNVLMGRLLGAEGMGVYFVAVATVTVATTVSRLGLDNTVIRFVAAELDEAETKDVYVNAFSLVLPAALAITVILFVIGPWLGSIVLNEKAGQLIRWMSLSVPFTAFALLHAQFLKAVKRVGAAITVQSLVLPLALLIILPLVVSWAGLVGVAVAYILATVAMLTISASLFSYDLRQLKPSAISRQKLLRSSKPLFVMSLLQLVINWSPTFILGAYTMPEDVGAFELAKRAAVLIGFILFAVDSVAAPRFAALYKNGDMKELEKTAKDAALLMMVFSAPLLLMFVSFPNHVMSIFGSDFADKGYLLIILALGQFVTVITGSVQHLLMMCGYEKDLRNATAITALLCVFSSLVLASIWGAAGNALALSLSLAIHNIRVTFIVKKRLNISVIPGIVV